MLEYLFYALVGGTFMYGCIHWINSVNTRDYIKHIKLTIFVFVIIMVGILFVNSTKVNFITDNVFREVNPLWIIGMIAISFPAIIYIFLNEYITISEVFYKHNWFISFFIVLMGMGLITLNIPYKETIIFLFLMPTIGFLHGLLGPLIASFNISLVLTYLFKQKALNLDINTVFDSFSFINISDPSMKWAILIISTFFGLLTLIEKIIKIHDFY